jgi:hypothetical protein
LTTDFTDQILIRVTRNPWFFLGLCKKVGKIVHFSFGRFFFFTTSCLTLRRDESQLAHNASAVAWEAMADRDGNRKNADALQFLI